MASLILRNGLSARDPFLVARELFADPFFSPTKKGTSSFLPLFDVVERDGQFVITADLPGVVEDDLDIRVEKNVLTVSGTRNAEEKKEDESYHVVERRYGSFTRTFTLPETADVEGISAKLEAGVLTLIVPKKEKATPRKIAITR